MLKFFLTKNQMMHLPRHNIIKFLVGLAQTNLKSQQRLPSNLNFGEKKQLDFLYQQAYRKAMNNRYLL